MRINLTERFAFRFVGECEVRPWRLENNDPVVDR
jgi:hypothetical protein